jgi:hypothetical protein
VLAGSVTLERSEQVAIAAAVSVARSSFAYWRVNLPAFAQEVDAEYRGCLERYRKSGKAPDQVRNICLRGADVVGVPLAALAPTIIRQAGLERSRQWCFSHDYRAIARDDARGAFDGARLGGVPGAVEGATAASIRSAVQGTWSRMTCAVGE